MSNVFKILLGRNERSSDKATVCREAEAQAAGPAQGTLGSSCWGQEGRRPPQFVRTQLLEFPCQHERIRFGPTSACGRHLGRPPASPDSIQRQTAPTTASKGTLCHPNRWFTGRRSLTSAVSRPEQAWKYLFDSPQAKQGGLGGHLHQPGQRQPPVGWAGKLSISVRQLAG